MFRTQCSTFASTGPRHTGWKPVPPIWVRKGGAASAFAKATADREQRPYKSKSDRRDACRTGKGGPDGWPHPRLLSLWERGVSAENDR